MSTEPRIKAFIIDELRFPGSADDLDDDYPLLEKEVLDSMGIFQVVGFLERDFGIVVEDEDLIPSNFESISGIARFVAAKKDA